MSSASPGFEAEIFGDVDEGVALVVGHVVAVEPAEPEHAHEIFRRIELAGRLLLRGGGLFRRRRSHPDRAGRSQLGFDQAA